MQGEARKKNYGYSGSANSSEKLDFYELILRDLFPLLQMLPCKTSRRMGLGWLMTVRFHSLQLIFFLFSLSVLPAQTVSDWMRQINFRPTAGQQTALMTRASGTDGGIWYFTKLEAGTGPLCLDYFGLTITKAPQAAGRDIKPAELMHWVRTHLNDFLDPALASCRTEAFEDQWRWESDTASVGAVLRFDLRKADPPGTSFLSLTEQNAAWWILSTVHAASPESQDWPVSGNRTFGWGEIKLSDQPNEEVPAAEISPKKQKQKQKPVVSKVPAKRSFSVYTRGAWRARAESSPAQVKAIMEREAELWKGCMDRVAAFVVAHGGTCGPASYRTGLFPQEWEPILNTSFAPSVSWVDPEGSWTSKDPQSRFRLVIHPGFRTCEFVERVRGGKELSRTVPMKATETGDGWKVERSSVDPEVLEFLGFDAAAREQIIAAAPPPSYLVFNRKGAALKASWNGFIVERDGKRAIAAIKAPGAFKPKEYEFGATPAPGAVPDLIAPKSLPSTQPAEPAQP